MSQLKKGLSGLLGDSDDDGDSDWDATNNDDDVCSVDGSVSINSRSSSDEEANSSASGSDDDTVDSPQKEAVKSKPTAKPKAASSAAKKVAKPSKSAAAKPKSKQKTKAAKTQQPILSAGKGIGTVGQTSSSSAGKKRIAPTQVPAASQPTSSAQLAAKMAAKAGKADQPPPPRIVKYNVNSASGVLGRPVKNAEVTVPPEHCPSEYPSVLAFRESPPTDSKQYVKVAIAGRKPSVCRAFRVTSLQPPHGTTYFALTTADDDAAALASLGVVISTPPTPQLKALAQAALHQAKNADLKTVAAILEQVDESTLQALGWIPDKDVKYQPAIMSAELADRILAPAPGLVSKKRPAEEDPIIRDQTPRRAAKRFAQELQELIGAKITNITFSVDVCRQDPSVAL